MGNGLPEVGGLGVVVAELIGDLVQVVAVQRLQRVADGGMEDSALGWQQALVSHEPDPVVAEVQPIADGVQDAAPDQLLDGISGLALAEAARAREKGEGKVTADGGRDGDAVSGKLGQTLQSLGDHLLNTAAWARLLRPGLGRVLLEAPDGFHDDERISLAEGPDLALELIPGPIGARRGPEGSPEGSTLGLR